VGAERADTNVPVTTWTPEHQDGTPPIVKQDALGRGVLAVLVDRPDQVGQDAPAWWTAALALCAGAADMAVVVVVAVGPAVDQSPSWAQAGRAVITQSANRTVHPAWAPAQNKKIGGGERSPGLF
jgi:hypothetical protein